jgi:hypothetical protein
MPRCIASKHPDLAILDFAEGATILPRDPHGIRALFDEAGLIKHQDAVWLPHLLGYELMVIPHHLLLIPVHITDELLQPTDRAPFDVESHRLNRLAFELAQLAYHIVQEMSPRLTACITVVKG